MSYNTCVYRHRTLDTNEIFYIGIGNIKRPFTKKCRSNWWKSIINKHGYTVEVLSNNLSWEDACELEELLISLYGRRDLGKGTLVNMTDGGDGVKGIIFSEEAKIKISNAAKLRIISESTRELKRKSMLGKKGTNNVLLLDLYTGIFYDSIKDAAKALNLDRWTLSERLRGKRKNNTSLIIV